MQKRPPELLRVTRSKEQAINNYNRISTWYDALAGRSEKRLREGGLRQLNTMEGETVLEIGCGTGHCILELARDVGESGTVHGIDISDRMLDIAAARVIAAGFEQRVELKCCDAMMLPYPGRSFNAIFMSFTLELFDTPELGPLLQQCRRVLKPDGRFCVVAMSALGNRGIMAKLYEWAHIRFPRAVDCRPIYAEQLLRDSGFDVTCSSVSSLWGLSVETVLSRKRTGMN